jgi:hypothetical protein
VQHAAQQIADAQVPDRDRGLYAKWQARRIDGSSEPGKKHHACELFVLDLNHDPHAIPALFSYASSAQADGYELLAGNLFAKIQPYLEELEQKAKLDLLDDIKALPEISGMDNTQLLDTVIMLVQDDLPSTGKPSAALSELLIRFADLTKPKRTRKKKDEQANTDQAALETA